MIIRDSEKIPECDTMTTKNKIGLKSILSQKTVFLHSAILCLAFSNFFHADLAQSDEDRGMSIVSKDGKRVGEYEGSYALLIGNSSYANGWSDLQSVILEMKKVKQVLELQGFLVEYHTNLKSSELAIAYESFIKRYGYDSNNRLLLYYSGHGFSRNNGTKGYLVPTDAPDPNIDERGFLRGALSMSRIMSLAREMEAKHGLFLFDSCFSGSIFKSRSLSTRTGYISRLTAEPVRQFITSGSAGEKVPAKSVFTPAFVDGISHGLADLNKDGYVTGTELGLFLQETVTQFLPQTPQFGKINDYELSRGDFVLSVPSNSQSSGRKDLKTFLSALEMESKSEQSAKATAQDIMKVLEMRKSFEDVDNFEAEGENSLLENRSAWRYFLDLYAVDLPGLELDDELRSIATARIASIDQAINALEKAQSSLPQIVAAKSLPSIEDQKNRDYISEMEASFAKISPTDLQELQTFLVNYRREIPFMSLDDELRTSATRMISAIELKVSAKKIVENHKPHRKSSLETIAIVNQLELEGLRIPSFFLKTKDENFERGLSYFNNGLYPKAIESFSN